MFNLDLCVICQENTVEALICPLDNPVISKRQTSYGDFLAIAAQLKAVGGSPHPQVVLPELQILHDNRAKWHKSCRQLYRKTDLDRAISRMESRETETPVRAKRIKHSQECRFSHDCLFCGEETSQSDHSFMKTCLTSDIKHKAETLGHNRIIHALAAGGDLISIEARYHRDCYIRFNREYDRHITPELTVDDDLETTVDEEIYQTIREEVADGKRIFGLQDITEMKEDKLKHHGMIKTVNRTRLKQNLLEKFPDLVEEKGTRDRVFLICSETARKIMSHAVITPEQESRILLSAASILRKDVCSHPSSRFQGSFAEDSEMNFVPKKMKYFFRQLLAGPNSEEADENSRKVLSTTQIAMLHMSSLPNGSKPEPPISIFLGLKIHQETRSRKLVNILHRYGFSVSYDTVLSIIGSFSRILGDKAKTSGIVCSSNLRQHVFTVAALDNLDHNPTSRTSTSSFHGTGISIFQFPTHENPGLGQEPIIMTARSRCAADDALLPASYTFVPPLGRTLCVQPPIRVAIPEPSKYSVEEERRHEENWLQLIEKHFAETADSGEAVPIMWAAYHASRSSGVGDSVKCIEALLPLFHEKAATAAMIRHGMELVQQTTHFLSPVQISVLVVDQPLYDIAKKIQWTFPEKFGEDMFVVMLGGLHIEMALWSTIGDMMQGAGWVEALVEAGVTKSEAAATALMKSSNVMRTRYAHQITVAVLGFLMKRAHTQSGSDLSLDAWIVVVAHESPTILFWMLIQKYEILIFMFIRSHRERKFALMLDTLRYLVPLFFAMDHQNYARWVPVFIRDMESLPPSIQEEFENGHWTITKGVHRFSSMPIDQAHEQANKRVKGAGGMIGLTEHPKMLERWAIYVPELSRILEDFESNNDDNVTDYEYLPHHEEGLSSQSRYHQHVSNLLDIILKAGNPFEETSNKLVSLDNKECEAEVAVECIRLLESKGQEQYNCYKRDVLELQSVTLQMPIKKNNLKIFNQSKVPRKSNVNAKISHFKQHADLYGRAFVVAESRGVNLADFFAYESSPYPPALATKGKIHSCTKSDLLECLLQTSLDAELQQTPSTEQNLESDHLPPESFDVIINDGGALIHSLPPGTGVQGKSFDEYVRIVFKPRMLHDLARAKRVDVVWDDYRQLTIKGTVRDKRGAGMRQRVSGEAKVPTNWSLFLADSCNKIELFGYLSTSLEQQQIVIGNKNLYVTAGPVVRNLGNGRDMLECNHEEADTRVVVHLAHALEDSNTAMIFTGDTDVIVILLANFHHLLLINPNAEIWLCFKAGKTTKMISINRLARNLGTITCKGLALFHSLTGCDSTSSFRFKGKRLCYNARKQVSSFITECAELKPFNITDSLRNAVYSFVCHLYSNDTSDGDVNTVRMNIFCRKTRDVERIPPTNDALALHLLRSVYQASIWISACSSQIDLPRLEDHGWVVKDGKVEPIWITKSTINDVFQLDVKCHCSKGRCALCKCSKAGLKCTRLCTCSCIN